MGCCNSCDNGGPCEGGCSNHEHGHEMGRAHIVLPGELSKHQFGPIKWGTKRGAGRKGGSVEIGAAAGQGSYRDDSRELANYMSKGGSICTPGFDWGTFLQNIPLHIGNWTAISDIYGTGQATLYVLPTGMIVPNQTVYDLFAMMVPGMDLTSYLQGIPDLQNPGAVMSSCMNEVNPASFSGAAMNNDAYQAALAYCVNCYGWAMGQGSNVKYSFGGGTWEVPMASHIIPIYFGPAGPNYVDSNGAPILFAQNIKDLLQTFNMGTTLDRAQNGEGGTTVGLKGFVQACSDGSLFGYAGPPTASGQDIPGYGSVPNPNFDPSQPPSPVNPPFIPSGSTGVPGSYPPSYGGNPDPNAIDPATGIPYGQEYGGTFNNPYGGGYPQTPYYPDPSQYGGMPAYLPPTPGGYGPGGGLPMFGGGNLIPFDPSQGGGGMFGGGGGGLLGNLPDPMQLVQELLGMVSNIAQPVMDMVSPMVGPVLDMLPGMGQGGFEVPFMPQGVSDPNFAYDYCTANPMDPACQGDASVMQGEVGASVNPLLTRKQVLPGGAHPMLTPAKAGTPAVAPHPAVAQKGKQKAASSPVVWKKMSRGQRAAQLQRYRKGGNSHSKAPDFTNAVKKASNTALNLKGALSSPTAKTNLAVHLAGTGHALAANTLIQKAHSQLNAGRFNNVAIRGEGDDGEEYYGDDSEQFGPFDSAAFDPSVMMQLMAAMAEGGAMMNDGSDIDPMTYPPMTNADDSSYTSSPFPQGDGGGGMPTDPNATNPGAPATGTPPAGAPPLAPGQTQPGGPISFNIPGSNTPAQTMPVNIPISRLPGLANQALSPSLSPSGIQLMQGGGFHIPTPVQHAINRAPAPVRHIINKVSIRGESVGGNDFLSSLTNLITSKDKGDPKADKAVDTLSKKSGGNDELINEIATNVIKYAPLLIAVLGEGDYSHTSNSHLYELARRGDKSAVHELFQRVYAGDVEATQYARRLLGLPEKLESAVMGLYPSFADEEMFGPWHNSDEAELEGANVGAFVPSMADEMQPGPFMVGAYDWQMSQDEVAHVLNQSTEAVTNLMNLAASGDPHAQACVKAIVEAAKQGNPRAQAIVMLTKPNYLQPYPGTGEKTYGG
jgi:hypothetical protein